MVLTWGLMLRLGFCRGCLSPLQNAMAARTILHNAMTAMFCKML